MGISTKATLAYGYRLQGNDGEWFVREVHGDDSDEYGLNVDWYDEDEDHDGFAETALARLLITVGFTETDWRADGFFARKREAEARLGVEFESTGYEGNELLLVTKQYGADLGDVEEIDPAAMIAVSGPEADERLRAALAALGLTPTQEKPAWLLTAYRG